MDYHAGTAFAHRHNQDGTFDSICKTCFMTIMTAGLEADLQIGEKEHVCDPLQVMLIHKDEHGVRSRSVKTYLPPVSHPRR